MKEYKRVWNVYSAWDYTREIEDLNKMSDNGWQLIKGGCFSNRYKKNDSMRYRYQLDFNTNIEDMGRYIETFREQGWEYVNSTFNGWHYFRKHYDQAGDDYEIYSDTESLKEMQSKWQKIGTIFSVVLVIMAILNGFLCVIDYKLPSVLLTLTLIIEASVLGRGIYVMRNPQRADGHKRSWNGMPAFLTVLLIGLVSSIVLMGIRGSSRMNTNADSYPAISAVPQEGVNWTETKVTYPDFYTFEVEGNASNPITLSLVNMKTGDLVSQIRLDPAEATNKKGFKQKNLLFLKPGNYIIYGSDFAGGSLDLHVSLD